MVGSGAGVHCCPETYAKEIPIEASGNDIQLAAVSGGDIPHHGCKHISGEPGGAQRARVPFEVADVNKRPCLLYTSPSPRD
eukprot:9316680-Alexandrium_andersonii.AAC.1